MSEERLTTLETHVAFQERTLQDLSDVICSQQKEIEDLKSKLENIEERLKQADEAAEGEPSPPEVEIPPHY